MQKEDKGDSPPFQASGKNPTSFLKGSYPKLHYSLTSLAFKIWKKKGKLKGKGDQAEPVWVLLQALYFVPGKQFHLCASVSPPISGKYCWAGFAQGQLFCSGAKDQTG